jgi:hypothetical protein
MFKKDFKIAHTSTVVVLPGLMSPTPSTPENAEEGRDEAEPAYEGDIKM